MDMETRNKVKVAEDNSKSSKDKVDQLPSIGDEVQTNLGLGHIRLMPDVNDNYIVLINGHHIPVNTVNVKKLDSPKQESSEWPQVGDEVIAVNPHNNIKGKLLALTKKYAIIYQGNDEQHLHLSAWTLEKPKTPEEELVDEIADVIDNASCSEQAAEYIVKEYLTLTTKKQ